MRMTESQLKRSFLPRYTRYTTMCFLIQVSECLTSIANAMLR